MIEKTEAIHSKVVNLDTVLETKKESKKTVSKIKKTEVKETESLEDGNQSDSSITSSASSKKSNSKNTKDESNKPKSKGKAKIPAAVRKIVWNTYIGKDNTTGKCLVCSQEDISNTNFECGHVKSAVNGGDITIENLRPICGNCNKSIGGNDMDMFMDKHKIKKPDNWNGLIENTEIEKDKTITSKKAKTVITKSKQTATSISEFDSKNLDGKKVNNLDPKDIKIAELEEYILKLKRKIYDLINEDNDTPLQFNPDDNYLDYE